jgi:hypothetical protein
MPSPNDAAEAPLIVEHRLRLALSTLDCLKRLSSFADEPHNIQLFGDAPEFARVVWQFARTTEVHLRAANAALAPRGTQVDASVVSGDAMTPRDAAQRFVGLVLRTTFDDVLDLTDRVGLDNDAPVHARKSAYAEVEAAVRRRFRTTHDLDALEAAVSLAAPDAQRDDVAMALSNLLMAVADEFTVKQQSGYVVGIAVGKALSASAAGEMGDGRTPSTP